MKNNKDRDFILESLAKQSEDVVKRDLDMMELEDGVHELRRIVRWILMYSSSLDGLIQVGSPAAHCSVAAYKDIHKTPISNSKYVIMPPATHEPKPCALSACLIFATAKVVKDLGDIKDEGQGREAVAIEKGEDADLHDLLLKADVIYKEIKKNKLMESLANDFRSCRR